MIFFISMIDWSRDNHKTPVNQSEGFLQLTFKFWKQKSVFPLVELDLMFHGVVELLDKDMPRTITFFLLELICVTFFLTQLEILTYTVTPNITRLFSL